MLMQAIQLQLTSLIIPMLNEAPNYQQILPLIYAQKREHARTSSPFTNNVN